MAGRYIIMEFRNKDDAGNFIENQTEWNVMGGKIIAEFMRPDKFCDCPDKRRQNVSNWAKGSRTGLYLCKVCKKPSVHHQRGIMDRLRYVFGKNLLEG